MLKRIMCALLGHDLCEEYSDLAGYHFGAWAFGKPETFIRHKYCTRCEKTKLVQLVACNKSIFKFRF